MKTNYIPEFPVTDEAAKAATGKTLDAWFRLFDERGGPATSRSNRNAFLYKEQGVDPWWATTISVEYERARRVRKRDGTLTGYTVCVTKIIAAGPPRVFEAFTDPELLARWFAPETTHVLEVGGRFDNADGNEGAYKKIQPAKALKFTWEGQGQEQDSVVNVQFHPKGEHRCGLILTHDRIANRGEADGLRTAWGEAVVRLKELLESTA